MARVAVTSEIYAEQVRMLFRQTPIALAVNVINAAVTAAVLAAVVPPFDSVIWFSGVAAVAGMRYALYRRYGPAESAHPWDRLAILGSCASGSLWGFGCALLFPPGAVYQIFLGLTVGGMCAGAVVVHSSHFPSLLAFLLPASLPMAARFMLEGTAPGFALAGMMILFATALSVAGYNFNRSLVATLRLRFDLARQAHELETANTRLIEETRVRRAAEEALRQAEKMDALGRLTGGLAHDFNNLLTIILGSLERLGPHVRDDEPSRRLLAAARDGAERGAKLTHSLLSFARQQQLKPEPVNANAAILDFEPLLRRAIGENAELKLSLSPELATCRIDPTHFQTALLNLVLNAWDALPSVGGSITIATENAAVSAREAATDSTAMPGAYVSVSVSDSGVGMAPEVVARAFEPFYTTKEVGKGSGLGLSQVYGFVTQSGGTVTIASAPMAGTTVRLLLPAVSGATPAARRDAAIRDSGESVVASTILVVEDDTDLLSIVAEDLTELGYQVLTARDGPTALAYFREGRRVDLLFSDIVMPNGIRGDELARRAVALHPKLKVLLTSGYSDPDAARQFRFIPKPFRRNQLAEALHGMLRR